MRFVKAANKAAKMALILAGVLALSFSAAGCGRDGEVIFSTQEEGISPEAEQTEKNSAGGENTGQMSGEEEKNSPEMPGADGKSTGETSGREEKSPVGSSAREEKYSGKGSAEDPDDAICVYVTGAVHCPGVYELADGARVADAVASAGGFSEEAASEWVNLAARAADGMQIHVPTLSEVEKAGGTMPWGVRDGAEPDAEQNSKININTADAQTLMTLSGIGKAKAEAIIAYREKHGPFSSVGEIRNVKGIKDSVFEAIEESITVD